MSRARASRILAATIALLHLPSATWSEANGSGGANGLVQTTIVDYAILRWPGNPDLNVKARFGTGAQVVDGHVCVDVLGMRGQSVIGSGDPTSDAIALRTSRTAMRFAKTVTIADDVITGGGKIRGEKNVVYGGVIDKSGTAPQLTECRDAAADAAAKHAQFTNPAIVGINGGTIDGGGQQTINATAPGCNIIDINEISLRRGATLNIVGGALTQSVIVRVATKMHLGRFVKIVLQGLTPQQVLFVVEGPFTSRRGVEIRGSVLGNHPIWIGRAAMVEGQLLSSRKVVLRRFSSVTNKPFVDWFGTCGQPSPTPTRTTAAPTDTPAPTNTLSPTGTAAPPTDTATLAPPATDTPVPASSPTPTETSSPGATTTETATATQSPTATAAPPDTATPSPTAGPDLVESVVVNPPASVQRGTNITVQETVLNQGGAPAGASKTRYYISLDQQRSANDQRLEGTRIVPGLAAGATSPGIQTVTVQLSITPGTYYLIACTDDLLQVQETDETNNCTASATTMTILP